MDKSIETYIDQIIKRLNCDEEEKYEIRDEMRDHLYLLKNEFLEEGLSEEESTQRALKSFGEQKPLIDGYREVIFPFYSLFKMGTWVLFGIYTLIVMYYLLIKRIIVRVYDYIIWGSSARNNFFFYPKDSNGFFDIKVWQENSNLIPFRNMIYYLNSTENLYLHDIINNTLGNILIFIPLGFFLPIIFRRYNKSSKVVIISIIISLSLEILQFALQLGQFDIDDIILNAIGSMVGFTILKVIYRVLIFTKNSDLRRTSN